MTILFAVLILLLFPVMHYQFGKFIPNVDNTHAANTITISLVGYYLGWNHTNPAITVTQDSIVTINLSSGDTVHKLQIDFDNDGVNDVSDCGNPDVCSIEFPPSTSITFTASTVGSFTYFCTIHRTTMVGTFQVQPATPPPTQTGDFSVSISPSSQNIAVGSSGQYTATVQSLNNFTGSVSITPSISPAGTTVSANPSTVNVPSGGSAMSTLTVTTTTGNGYYSSSTPEGTYTVTVTGTSGSTSHQATATVNVGTSSSPSSNNNNNGPTRNTSSNAALDTTMIGAIIGAIVLGVIILGSVIYLRRR
jgi:hypothetical protein